MKNTKKAIISTTLALLLLSIATPALLINNVNGSDGNGDISKVQVDQYGAHWWKIKTDLITILFPSGGKKPMFLWWYSNDTDNIYVVKYKGLIEYMTIDYEYYTKMYEANQLTIRERLEAKYASQGPHQTQIRNRITEYFGWLLGLHPAYLPFSACRWNLTGPINVTREDGVSYISFNFTLTDAPAIFDFAEGNVIIRCRFYATEATENVYDLYNYTVKPGELKMDLIIQNWEWNIDKLNSLFETLQEEFDITVPKLRAGLALWIDMASINIEEFPIAEQDANSTLQVLPQSSYTAPLEPVETNSDTSDIIAGGQRIQLRNNVGSTTAPLNVRTRLHERFRLRFARGSQTLAGFFDFVNTAVVINSTTQEKSIVNVTAAYISAGNHMRLFIGYPYFSSNTLEHDPSIGVENVVPWLSTNLLMILIGATIAIAMAVAAVKMRKKTVNIVSVR
ncbi:MAG: hypothetical protein OEY22_07605 [Candidatus Bathyarchaeota archaeon]|nr:hypothetical protein [Candidatus Bathyarchaeota archaeon]MDH5787454.1 hypothetical protein [Candidatus Bathyarchaeota archaeon]